MVGNGDSLSITHVGTGYIGDKSCTVPLQNVLVVPEIKKSLLSVHQLTNDYPCYFVFRGSQFYLKDVKTNQILLSGTNSNGLYTFKEPQVPPVTALFSHRHRSADEQVWHRRLGHPNTQVLQHLRMNKFISVNKPTVSLCDSCQISKSAKLPFYPSESRAVSPLGKIHCDLWGPAPIPSFQQFRYYVIFIDDFSRYCWLYPLKQKSDFIDVFVGFQKLVETQFTSKIKTF